MKVNTRERMKIKYILCQQDFINTIFIDLNNAFNNRGKEISYIHHNIGHRVSNEIK